MFWYFRRERGEGNFFYNLGGDKGQEEEEEEERRRGRRTEGEKKEEEEGYNFEGRGVF